MNGRTTPVSRNSALEVEGQVRQAERVGEPARASSTASGEQQLRSPSVAWSAQSLSVTATTSVPRARLEQRRDRRVDAAAERDQDPVRGRGSARVSPEEATPPSARWSASAASSAAWRRSGESPPSAAATRSGSIRARFEHFGSLGQLAERRRGRPGRGAALGVEARARDPAGLDRPARSGSGRRSGRRPRPRYARPRARDRGGNRPRRKSGGPRKPRVDGDA